MVHLEQALASGGEEPRRFLSGPLTTARLALLLAIAAVVTRMAAFGDPVAHVDDEFYLLVGRVMLEGGWPYVDIWDRKPVGLFALYAAIAGLFGPYAVEGVQLVAGLFAWATALVVARIAEAYADRRGALLAGIAYLLCLPMFGGQTGQSPVFYNLLIALAAWQALQALEESARPVFRRALVAMLLCGLAMTIKQISFIEGGFLGLVFLWRFHQLRLPLSAIAVRAAAMIALALLPTVTALAVYAAAGHADAFIFANFVSIFRKHPVGGMSLYWGLQTLAKFMPAILGFALLGAWARHRAERWTSRNLFLLGWIVAAWAGYLFVPYFFDHYALPLLVPLSISAATLYERRFGLLLLLVLAALAIADGMLNFANHGRRIEASRTLSTVIAREARGGCLYLVSGRTHFHSVVPPCPTRFVFPDHLNDDAERDGIGVDQLAEVRRVFAVPPMVVITSSRNEWRRTPRVKAFVDGELVRHYRPVFRLPGKKPSNLVTLTVWSRRDAPPAAP